MKNCGDRFLLLELHLGSLLRPHVVDAVVPALVRELLDPRARSERFVRSSRILARTALGVQYTKGETTDESAIIFIDNLS